MRINLLPEDKKPDSGAVSASGPRQVPMSTPVPIDGVATHQPIALTPSPDDKNNNDNLAVPTARKYSTIATDQSTANNEPVNRTENLPRLERDRSGKVEPPVFAARRADPTDLPLEKSKIADSLPKAEKPKVPDEMLITKEHSLDTSVKGNLLQPINEKQQTKLTVPVKDSELPKIPPTPAVTPPAVVTKLQSQAPVVERKVKRDWRPVGYIISVVLAIAVSVVSWWGILAWQDQQVNKLTDRRDALSQQVEMMEVDKDAGLRLQAQLDVAADWLKQSRDYSAVLRALEQSVLPTTTYVAVDVISPHNFVVKGEASTMEDVARQFAAFETVEGVDDTELVETSLQNGVASFAFDVTLVN